MTPQAGGLPHTKPAEVTFPQALQDPADPRLKHRILPWDGEEEAHVVLLGVPFDRGVELAGGRPGAAGGPEAFRQALLRFGTTYDSQHKVDFDHLRIRDAGDLEVVPEDVGATHDRLTGVVQAILEHGAAPVVVGGGHDATFASVRALFNHSSTVAGINVDAHLDLREIHDGQITSGTPFRRILEELGMTGEDLVEFALHGSANARAHLEYAEARDVHCWSLGQVRKDGAGAVFESQLRFLDERADSLFVSVDLDVFAGGHAPGVSAPGTEGLTPAEGRLVSYSAGVHPTVKLFELMELNPRFDVDERTARLAVMLLTSFLAGFACREETA